MCRGRHGWSSRCVAYRRVEGSGAVDASVGRVLGYRHVPALLPGPSWRPLPCPGSPLPCVSDHSGADRRVPSPDARWPLYPPCPRLHVWSTHQSPSSDSSWPSLPPLVLHSSTALPYVAPSRRRFGYGAPAPSLLVCPTLSHLSLGRCSPLLLTTPTGARASSCPPCLSNP